MKRAALTLVTPPFAVCKFGCAGCCAAPIGVFWITGMVAIGYGIVGGPTNLMGPSWSTIGLGLALWAIASVWAGITIRSAGDKECSGRSNRLCERLASSDESDPFDEVRKAR